jgi:hypothetical protein
LAKESPNLIRRDDHETRQAQIDHRTRPALAQIPQAHRALEKNLFPQGKGAVMSRYVYSYHRTKAKAEEALKHYFAAGEVVEGDQPTIEKHDRGWAVTLPV